MRNLLIFIFCTIHTAVFANDLGKDTYQTSCKSCHAPQLAIGMKAPAAFDKKAWDARFKNAEMEAQKTQLIIKRRWIIYYTVLS